MYYGKVSVGSVYIPKLLGTYEREIAGVVEKICARQPELIVDVGAAEGYYAIGLARRNPKANVIGFEMDEAGRRAMGEMATLNGIGGRLDIRGACDRIALAGALADATDSVVICDAEGAEDEVLDPVTVPALAGASILVEVHDFIVPGIADRLRSRFAPTHRIEEIGQVPRSSRDFPWQTFVTRVLGESTITWAVNEWRPATMSWLWMEPKRRS